MASLTNTKIKDTYDGLLKTTDNDALGGTYKLITDGLGNSSGLYLGTGGRLGIGESSPSVDLHIKGSSTSASIVINGSSGSNNRIYGDNVGNLIYQADTENNGANSTHRWKIDGSEKMRITSDGKLGLGTSSPLSILDLGSNSNTSQEITISGGRSTYGYDASKGASGAVVIQGSANKEIHFETTADSADVVIDSSGRVGIGVSSPSSYLEIETSGSSGSDDIAIFSRSTGEVLKISREAGEAVLNASSNLTLSADYDNNTTSTGSNVIFKTDATERMRIDSTGNAIFTKSGGAYLQLKDASAVRGAINVETSDGLIFTTGSSFTERMRIDSSGRVGLGTSSPDNAVSGLHISVASSTDQLYLERTGSATGRYYLGAAANSLIIVDDAQSTERLRIDSSGNLGLGTSSPSAKLDVNGTSIFRDQLNIDPTGDPNNVLSLNARNSNDYANLIFRNSGGSANWAELVATPNTLAFETSGSEAMRIDSSGDLNIVNTGQASLNFTTDGSSDYARITGGKSGSGVGDLRFFTYSSGIAERLRITSGGDILFGTTGIPNGTSVYGSAFIDDTDSANILKMASSKSTAKTLIQFLNPNGSVGTIQTNGSATAYNTSSDYRLKENVIDLTGALDRVDQLEPKRFNFIADEDTTVDGFLAHEVQNIVPEAVTGEKDAVDDEGNPEFQGIDQSKIVPLLVGAIKELKAEIETLKSQINS